MSLFTEALPWLIQMREQLGARFQFKVSPGAVPLNMAYDATLEELQLENAKLRVRLHHNKQHARNVTRQLLELSQQHAALQTESKRLQAEVDYWHARCSKYVAENGDMPQPPSQG